MRPKISVAVMIVMMFQMMKVIVTLQRTFVDSCKFYALVYL